MSVHRENILTLIGGRRYHSCILTTFSFDFYFFEMKVMKWLRSCGVRNINVFIDGHYYSELMQQTTGEEMKLTPGYSLFPFFHPLIFHPKIWMLFGENEGLLIIGSGNLTNSGNGNNDEVWSAFHFDIRFTENAQIFSESWQYLTSLASQTVGMTNEKTTRWIIEHAKWINDLPKPNGDQFCKTSQQNEIAFLCNSDEKSIWSSLLQHLRNENVIEITTVSPFYDVNGVVIKELNSAFPKSKVNIVLDENGLIPASLIIKENYSIYDWYDIGVSRILYSRSGNCKSKLHGKILHFKLDNGKEYCLLGSANVTPEGMGLYGFNKSNTEVSVLMKSENGQILSELGIKLSPSKVKNLQNFSSKPKNTIYDTLIHNNRFPIKLLSAEFLYHELILFSSGVISGDVQVQFFDSSNRQVHQVPLAYENEIKLKIGSDISEYQYVQFSDISGKANSNKLIIADYFLLAKTHPNPQTEEIERLYSEIQNGELAKILDLLNFVLLDESESDDAETNPKKSSSKKGLQEEKTEPEQLYDLSTYKTIIHPNFEKSLLLTSPSLRVLDVLKFVQSKIHNPEIQDDIRGDEQETDISAIQGNEAGEVKVVQYQMHSVLSSERRKLMSFLRNISAFQHDILYGKHLLKDYKVTLTDLTKYLICLELFIEYGGRTERYIENKGHYTFNYLPFTSSNDENVKSYCLSIIGEFLLLCQKGFKQYEFEYTRMKIEQLKCDALINSLVCIINNNWVEKDMYYFYSLVLNTMHYLGWKDFVNDNTKCNDLKSGIKSRINQLKHRANGLERNLNTFFRVLNPAFRKVIHQIQDKSFDCSAGKGNIIYKSPWGYCYVKSVVLPKKYVLVRPGYIWDKDYEDFIIFRPTEIYVPVELTTFICLDI